VQRSEHYIRLLVATFAAIGSSIFVWDYTPMSMAIVRMRLGKDFKGFPGAAEIWHPLLIPVVFLLFGIFVIHGWRNKTVFELVVGCLWLYAFLWVLICLLLCLLPEIPMIESLHGPS